MKVYNTLTRRKEEFIPLDDGKVKMYACGITVSGDAHIGHAIQAMIFDIMRKYFEKKGYEVTYCRNYTDVDDKIINNANKNIASYSMVGWTACGRSGNLTPKKLLVSFP